LIQNTQKKAAIKRLLNFVCYGFYGFCSKSWSSLLSAALALSALLLASTTKATKSDVVGIAHIRRNRHRKMGRNGLVEIGIRQRIPEQIGQ